MEFLYFTLPYVIFIKNCLLTRGLSPREPVRRHLIDARITAMGFAEGSGSPLPPRESREIFRDGTSADGVISLDTEIVDVFRLLGVTIDATERRESRDVSIGVPSGRSWRALDRRVLIRFR